MKIGKENAFLLVNMQQTVYIKMLLCSNCFIYHLSCVAEAAQITEWSRELMAWAALALLIVSGFGFLAFCRKRPKFHKDGV